ncbi:hypothetical protein [Streptomyces amritsarensis]|uniref:hypothetical protein n=1 Tax=Streptomyces amritsarensis TaxID=681158 RepID=UPI00367EF9E7
MTAAVMAAGLGLSPSAASAAEGPAKPAVPGQVKAEKAAKGTKPAGEKFHSPADRTVRTALPDAGNKAAAGHPGIEVAIDGRSDSAYGLVIDTKITAPDTLLDVVIDWGDGRTEKASIKGSGALSHGHSYAELGNYKVKVTATDVAKGVQAANEVAFVTPGAKFVPIDPTRMLDTRNGTGTSAGKVPGRGSTRVKVASSRDFQDGLTAVALNVTVTNTTDSGHVTVWSGDKNSGRPDTSNLNYTAGGSVPNMVIVPVGADGYVELFNGGWSSVDLIADITGRFVRTGGSGYTSMAPARFVDTREGLGTTRGQLAGRGTFETQISGLKGVPQGITAVALNVTVTDPKQAGHLSVFPGGPTPTASSLNFTAGQTVANSVIVPVSADGRISVFNGAWAGADVIVDVVGHYNKDSKAAYRPIGPWRTLDTRDPESWWPGGRLPARGYIPQWYAPDDDPAADEAFVLNTTVTTTVDSGFLSVAPSPFPWLVNDRPGAPVPPRPGSSTLNWTKGATVANLVQAASGDHGIVHFWNQGWKDADLIVDFYGIYETD